LSSLERSDPRLLIIPRRLSGIKRIIAIMSSKGGVGKTIITTLLALASARKGLKTGLLDLDFTNPSTHIVLGVDPGSLEYREEKGVIPPEINGLKYMTIAIFTRDNPTPLRGDSIDEAFKELLAITIWRDLDVLFIDTPPGMSNIHLNLLSYLGDRTEITLIATPSPLAIKSVERLIQVLIDGGYRINGLIENMTRNGKLREICMKYGIKYLGSIPYIEDLDNKIGDLTTLLNIKELRYRIEGIINELFGIR
jgi:ATP-binding protein involved in chromosome partitioning